MGTSIDLKIAGITIDWSKNSMGIDHGVLFQGSDRARCISDQIDYAYYDENPNDDELAVHEAAFVRPLAKILPRLDLLGYSLQAARAEYDGMISDEVGTDEDNGEPSHDYMSFDEFCTYACRRPLRSLSQIVDHEDEEVHKRAFPDDGNYLARLPFNHNSGFFLVRSELLWLYDLYSQCLFDASGFRDGRFKPGCRSRLAIWSNRRCWLGGYRCI